MTNMNDLDATEIQKRSFSEILRNVEAVSFVNTLIKDSYQDYFKGYEEEVGEMVDRAWSLLRESAGESKERLQQTVTKINSDIFRKQDPDFWFNLMYRTYKTEIRPKKDFAKLKQFINGKRILDYGSGGGYLALLMSQNGYQVSTTDVIDYRFEEAKHLPFRAMTSPTEIPYPDNSFDTVIIKAVLHHIDPNNLPTVLRELKRVSRRLLIEEDTYDLSKDMPELKELRRSQPCLDNFIKLSIEDQLQVLMLIDYFANAIAQGVVEMNFPFQFKSISQWKDILQSFGLTLTKTKLLGFQSGNVNKSCHVWLIVDKVS